MPTGFTADSQTPLHASCSEAICIVGGGAFNENGILVPFLARSTDQGATWVYSNDILSKLPADWGKGAFTGMLCQDKFCIATGSYQTQLDDTNFPLLAVSNDSGATWSYKTLPLKDDAGLSQPFCAKDYCAVTGYQTVNGYQEPLIAITRDNGATWTISNTTANLPEGFFSGGFFAGTDAGSSQRFVHKKLK